VPRGNVRNLTPGNPGSKGRGTSQDRKDAAEVRKLTRKMILDPVVQAKLLEKLQDGTAHPSLYSLMYAYAFGKPVEVIEQTKKIVPVSIQHVLATGESAEEAEMPFAAPPVVQ
jgi:hypothetical protein